MGPPTLRKRARTLFFLVLLATSCSGDDSASDASPDDARPVDTNRDVIRPFDAGPPPFDAGFDAAGEFDGEYYLRRVALVGEEVVERWRVAPTPDGDRSIVIGSDQRILDAQGVYYHVVSVAGQWVELVAIQTDGLPPLNTMCVDLGGCNPHRDRYIRPSE